MKNIKKYIAECEKAYDDAVAEAVDTAIKNKNKFILLAGASSAGKTTTSLRIDAALESHGMKSETVSLDDFYYDSSVRVIIRDGKPDFETPDSLELPLIRRTLADIAEGKPVSFPKFDFGVRKRIENANHFDPDDDTFIVVEGLHALNPDVVGDLPNAHRIYLKCEDERYDPKMLRRIIRDMNYRSASAELTLGMWSDVKRGENLYIKPYVSLADSVVDTHLGYELGAFRREGLAMIDTVPEGAPHWDEICVIKELLEQTENVAKCLVPKKSLLREFIG